MTETNLREEAISIVERYRAPGSYGPVSVAAAIRVAGRSEPMRTACVAVEVLRYLDIDEARSVRAAMFEYIHPDLNSS